MPGSTSGVIVTDVQRGSPAARAPIALQPGDVILRVDNQPVTSTAQADAIIARLRAAGRPSVLLLVMRDGAQAPIALTLTPTTPAPAVPSTPQRNPSPDTDDKITQPKPRQR